MSTKFAVFIVLLSLIMFSVMSIIPRSIRTHRVTKVLSEKILSYEVDSTSDGTISYTALTKSYKIQVFEKFPVPFVSKRETNFWVIGLDGEIVVSNSFIIPYNADDLINRIENYPK